MNQEQITAKIAEIQGENLNTAFALGQKAVERTQKLVDLNFAATKAVLEEAQDNLEQVMSAKDPADLASLVQSDAFATNVSTQFCTPTWNCSIRASATSANSTLPSRTIFATAR